MPAKGNPAFRGATRGTSNVPLTQTDPLTNFAHENLEQVGRKLLADHHDLDQRCNLSFVQIDAWLSQQQVNVKYLQEILEKLEVNYISAPAGKDSNTTKEIVSRLVDQGAQNGQKTTQSQTHAQSQLALHTNLADTIATIQSKIQCLHQEARREVLNPLEFERTNIVQTVIKKLGVHGILEKTLQTLRGEIQEFMRGACAHVCKTKLTSDDQNLLKLSFSEVINIFARFGKAAKQKYIMKLNITKNSIQKTLKPS
ncbi:uncharacterized protein MELLADRAFT_59573 [Melampsora larici-populina 98AG31]|uniref:Uncharacterized protein n=1 Tax=Melampsora larici-populina (strain 98AG31 / pathotype 3-4-7) TaxID=747676 RepID=F4R802_MELLP|nr:uncharacterized protein MELLADRAFT_59573 [Melampsora larici-populina 98AG31]EGG11408.1 hypothetical protein MELLADRAFT_59573 [Melampsora larici-populina 98AG31]